MENTSGERLRNHYTDAEYLIWLRAVRKDKVRQWKRVSEIDILIIECKQRIVEKGKKRKKLVIW